jgi:hypothetical protein
MYEGNGGGFTTDDYRGRVYVGRAPNDEDQEVSLEAALRDGRRQAGRGWLKIVEIRFKGENPITDYIVKLEQTDT